jgi:N-acetylneuraminic acid mutarotase
LCLGTDAQTLLSKGDAFGFTPQASGRQLIEYRFTDHEIQAGIAARHRMADPVALVSVEEEDLVRLGDRIVSPEMSDVNAAIWEHHVDCVRGFLIAVLPAAALALHISDCDETRLQERVSGHLSHVWRLVFRSRRGTGRPVTSRSSIWQRRVRGIMSSNYIRSLCAALGLAAVGCADSPASPSTGNQGWQTLASMPAARQEIATAVLNGLIYVIGGYDSTGQSTSSVFVYDPQSNTWSTAASLPIANNHGAAAVANGRLFAFGGVSNRVFVYNPAGNSWSEVASMIFEHGDTAAVAVINNKIYVAGGTGPGATQREVEVYDTIAGTWTPLAPMNVGRNHCAGGTIGGQFYVAGGRGSGGSDVALEVYDPAANSWTNRTPMPTARSGIGAGVVNNRLYVFGGEIPALHNEVESYDPVSNTWQQHAPMPTPKHGIWASVIRNTIYLPGGATAQGFGATTSHESFTVSAR